MLVGILGGGQLGQMLALAGLPLGIRCRTLDPASNPPAALAAETVRGDFGDPEALHRFRQGLDLVTYEWESVPLATVEALAANLPVYPSPAALGVAQDRLYEKTLFQQLAIPTPGFATVDSREDLNKGLKALGLPAVLKTRRLGYDGKGQFVIRDHAEADAAWATLGSVPLILEQFIQFDREVSLLAVRDRQGTAAFYPLVENRHRDGILRLSLAPASGWTPQRQAAAEAYGRRLLDALQYVGVLATEFFEKDGQLLANEMAPRVHNSGHWTIEGAVTSQFENHLRAVLGLPLGATAALGSWAMLNLLGTTPPLAALLAEPTARVHLYGKAPAPARKLGHVTLPLPEDPAEREQRLSRLLSSVSADS
jgi:5-(carboxyamino)imidazole ribonucleotide synthase